MANVAEAATEEEEEEAKAFTEERESEREGKMPFAGSEAKLTAVGCSQSSVQDHGCLELGSSSQPTFTGWLFRASAHIRHKLHSSPSPPSLPHTHTRRAQQCSRNQRVVFLSLSSSKQGVLITRANRHPRERENRRQWQHRTLVSFLHRLWRGREREKVLTLLFSRTHIPT